MPGRRFEKRKELLEAQFWFHRYENTYLYDDKAKSSRLMTERNKSNAQKVMTS